MPDDPSGLPPFARSWSRLYAVVIGSLVAQITLFYVLMRWLS